MRTSCTLLGPAPAAVATLRRLRRVEGPQPWPRRKWPQEPCPQLLSGLDAPDARPPEARPLAPMAVRAAAAEASALPCACRVCSNRGRSCAVLPMKALTKYVLHAGSRISAEEPALWHVGR